jgi:hypothetical protein
VYCPFRFNNETIPQNLFKLYGFVKGSMISWFSRGKRGEDQMKIFGTFCLLFFIVSLNTLMVGCGSKNNPATPVASTPTATPTVSIVWDAPFIEMDSINGTVNLTANMDLQVNGQAVTNAAVSLMDSTAATIWALPYYGPTTLGGQVYAEYYNYNNFAYTPADVYVLTTTALGKTASLSVTLPGSILAIPDGAGAITQVFSSGGDVHQLQVTEINPASVLTYNSTPTGASPYSIPVTAYTETAGYSYTFTDYDTVDLSSITNGSLNGPSFYAREYFSRTINF